MKKIVLSVIAILLFGAMANAQTQRNCEAIMRPWFQSVGMDPEDYPAEKTEARCLLSWCTFYFADEMPSGSFYFLFNELTNVLDGTHPAANTVVDLSTLSYYLYNFADFQFMYKNQTVYFELQGNQHRYLAMRPYHVAFNMAQEMIADMNKENNK